MNMSETVAFHELRGELRRNEPMGRHVTWRTGGAADRFYVPADLDDLAAFLRQLPPQEPLLFVGLGSNLLVRDGGWRGTVVLMHAASRRPEMREGLVYAEAGVASPKVARFAALHDLEGAEFLAGVPGTVGGALAMNAGCYGGETWEVVARVATINRQGRIVQRGRHEYDVGYRNCALRTPDEEWFAAAWFSFKSGDGNASRAAMKELLARRIATQPLSLPNAGSVFRNPPKHYAARLIESCGLKGLERGGACVSEKHANFIVNPKGAAKASDIEWLIGHVQRVVHELKGVQLATEVRIVGEDP
ncbi:MAG TPA: UDP-N-acetylmuramate dehydrogenase [Burkholderiales bacterium]|nr:UDP-N-acetylmuramate dehydrogenase [Burkholderiales bacterium]